MITTIENKLRRLGPYQALIVVALPLCLVEPSKLVAVTVLGEGHWLRGGAMIIAAYAVSLLLVERLFVIMKPQLLRIGWFARFWAIVVMMRLRIVAWASRAGGTVPVRTVARPQATARKRAGSANEQAKVAISRAHSP